MSNGQETDVTRILVVASILLVALIGWPFAPALFVACVLAGAVHPWNEWLAVKMRGRRHLASGVTTFGAVLALLLPIGSMAALVVKEAVEVITFVRSTLKSGGMEGLLHELPGPLQRLGERLLVLLPEESQSSFLSAEQGTKAAAAVGGVLSASSQVLLQSVMMLIAFYFLLVDGRSLIRWLDALVPSRRFQLTVLLAEFRKVSVAVLVSTAVTAGVQAVVALVGYLLARVPNSLFFTLVTFFIAFIPAVGAASVSLALAALMFLSGRPIAGTFLIVWGLAVVGLVDNVVKPLLIKGGMALHGAVVFFALLGGIAVFGVIGILAGPLIVAFFMAVMRSATQRIEGVDTPEPSGPIQRP